MREEEWYNFRTNPGDTVRVLAEVDERTYDPRGTAPPADRPEWAGTTLQPASARTLPPQQPPLPHPRRLGDAELIDPYRSGGGHRRYSRHQLRLAARARELCDQGTDMTSACRIVILEDQLEEALRQNESEKAR